MKKVLLALAAGAALLLSGCGSNDFDVPENNSSSGTSGAVGYTFFNISTPLTVSQAGVRYSIKAQLLHDGKVAPGKIVSMLPFNNIYGSLSNFTATTGTDGYASFEYISPDTMLKDGTQNTLTMVFTDENNGTVTAEVVLDFNASASTGTGGTSDPNQTLYAFMNSMDMTVKHGGEKKSIMTQLTANGIPVSGKTVTLKAFDKKFGTILNSYRVETNDIGYAVFDYQAPESLDEVNGSTAVFMMQFDEGDVHLETNATALFAESTDAIEGDITLPTVVVPADLRDITVDKNSKTITIPIKVYKDQAPYTHGKVKIELPEKVLNGADVGLFDAYAVDVNDQGIATFIYTAPSNLKALIDDNDTESLFKFYHADNTQNKQEMLVRYQAPEDDHVTRNYSIDVTTAKNFSMGIPEQEKTFTVVLKAKNSSGEDVALSDENITKITVTTTNGTIAQIVDTAHDNALKDSLDISPENFSSLILKSKKLSGLVPIRVDMDFVDASDQNQSLSTIINVRVYSGPPTAISISYVGTMQDSDRAKYIEKFAISSVDEYGNRVNTQPNITLGAIAGYAVDGREASSRETNETRRLFYGTDAIANGDASGQIDDAGDSDVSTTEFTDQTAARSDVFRYVNAEGNNTDKLVVFGAGKNYEAMGKWDIKLAGDNHTLTLQDQYYGQSRDDLYYAVGHNYYQDQCTDDGREWIGTTESETYQLDEEGTVIVSYKYDYHLTGKDVIVWVNLDGMQPDTGKKTRIGEATKHTLRGTGLISVPESVTLEKNTHVVKTFAIHHENAPEWYRNAHFGYRITGTCAYQLVANSNWFDARTCKASVTYDLKKEIQDSITVVYPDDNGTQVKSFDYTIQNSGTKIATRIALVDANGSAVTGAILHVVQAADSVLIDEISDITDQGDGNYTFDMEQHMSSTVIDTMKNTSLEDGKAVFEIQATQTTHYSFGNSSGTAYVTYDLQSKPDKGCTFGIEKDSVVVSDEF